MTEIVQPPQEDAIRQRRVQTLLGVWDKLLAVKAVSGGHCKLSGRLVNEVVEQYIADRAILRIRYQIKERIQLHKVAGLMAYAITRYRPVVPTDDTISTSYDLYANELLAAIHGVAICAEIAVNDGDLSFLDESWFKPWLKELIFLLHHRPYTAESLIFAFFTVCCLRFPHNLEKGVD